MKILYYLAAIGETNFSKKFSILLNNLKILNFNKEDIDILINQYDDSLIDFDQLDLYVNNTYTFFIKKGFLSEFWINNPHNSKLFNYDFIFFILDDVELSPTFDINILISKKIKYSLHIISPSITNSFYSDIFLNHPSNSDFLLTNWLELFLYLLTPSDFFNYLNTLSPSNKSTCGNDWLLGYHNFRLGIDFDNIAHHKFKGSFYSIDLDNIVNSMFKTIGYSSNNDYKNKNNPIVSYFNKNSLFIIPSTEIYYLCNFTKQNSYKKIYVQKKLFNLKVNFWNNSLQDLINFLISNNSFSKFLIISENSQLIPNDIFSIISSSSDLVKFQSNSFLISYDNLKNFNHISWNLNNNLLLYSELSLKQFFIDVYSNDSDWIYLPSQDFFGNDIFKISSLSIDLMKFFADKIEICNAFNTLGYFKSHVDLSNLSFFMNNTFSSSSSDWKSNGLYIKKIFIYNYFSN